MAQQLQQDEAGNVWDTSGGCRQHLCHALRLPVLGHRPRDARTPSAFLLNEVRQDISGLERYAPLARAHLHHREALTCRLVPAVQLRPYPVQEAEPSDRHQRRPTRS